MVQTASSGPDLGLELSAPVETWFRRRFAAPTDPQREAWPAIARGEDTLVSAPTGSGKTLAAFLVIIDRLVRRAMAGELEDRLEALYVSPLRALSHDIQRNLEAPLAEIRETARELGIDLPEIRAAVRTGDTPQRERQAMRRSPPHILVTTPESLFLLLTSERSREILQPVQTLIVDEIHALARDKRGSHLALSLARLDHMADRRPARIGLSATQRPIELLARFLVGGSNAALPGEATPDLDTAPCRIVDQGHQRDLELAIEVPGQEDLQAVAPTEQWDDLLDSIAERIQQHRTTLVFVNTRRLAERLAHRLGERLGESQIAAHHGSLARDRRLAVEARLKGGELRALVATASLELGIDIGSIDLVCQIGSPRSIATFLQRIGRSGHALGRRPKGVIYPTSRDELVECAALIRAVAAGRLDRIHPPSAPLDILAQQIVAAVAVEDWDEAALYELMRSADPFAALERNDFDAVLDMLARGFETPRGRRATYLHRDRIQGRLRARRGARLAAIRSGGAIPEMGDYRVVLDPDETMVGTVNEDWAIESMPGDIFLLGTHSWKIRRVEAGKVRVVDAQGAPPTIPFWLGEAPARTSELSREVSDLRSEIVRLLEKQGLDAAVQWLEKECRLDEEGARQIAVYIEVQRQSVGMVPTCEDLLVERFFDEAGGMQLVVHSPWGARINRGFGLALRKRFCRAFNLELQAAATDDALVLSLGNPQTFPLESFPRFLQSKTIEDVLTQALLDSPMFQARWRWNATRALAILRNRGPKPVPFPVQRMQADDLMAAAFPDLAACQENVSFPIDVPDHPLVRQTVQDSLKEACDIDGLRTLLERVESGEVRMHVRDTVSPSPFTHEILNAKPYAFLDDAPLEERRTRAVALRHVLPESAQDLGRLEPKAIARVREEALPPVRDADELYELLGDLVALRPGDLPAAVAFLPELEGPGRATRARLSDGTELLVAAERASLFNVLHPMAEQSSPLAELPGPTPEPAPREEAVDTAVRGHLEILGPTGPNQLGGRLGLEPGEVSTSLVRLEARGIALRGHFDPELEGREPEQFCDRSLLARIHRYTLAELRRAIEPVSAQVFYRFLLHWHHLDPETKLAGEGGTRAAIEQLAGFEAAVATWETDLLPARVEGYRPELLDRLCMSGEVAWGRLGGGPLEPRARPSRATPIALFPRSELDELVSRERGDSEDEAPLGGPARKLLELLRERGALFARELESRTRLLPVQLEEGLRELVARGLVTCDGFAPLRQLLTGKRPTARRRPRPSLRVTPRGLPGPEGRWGLLEASAEEVDPEQRAQRSAERLLRRYGVVFRDMLARESLPEGWRLVHRALRRLEARGEIRGGRFVSGFVGEQFALPEAIPKLRKERSRERTGEEVRISAADPLNLAGILTPGPRVPAGHTRALFVRDGLPVAVVERGRRRELGAEAPDARGERTG